ncbi:MAG: PilZ domain-containing protein [Treponema sp.]|nr:PilZ domain-containing protein [Treponema sp.]
MPVAISFLITALFLAGFFKLYSAQRQKIQFFSHGFDFSFRFSEIAALWKLAGACEIEEPLSLYYSELSVNKCIVKVIASAKADGTEKSVSVQRMLGSLYKIKTHIMIALDKKNGLESTQSLAEGQRICMIYKGKGVFNSKVLSNGQNITVLLPVQISKASGRAEALPAELWLGKTVSVYFWRKGDAGYTFDTEVAGSGFFRSDKALFLRQSSRLERTQKRQSVRYKCEIYARLFLSWTPEEKHGEKPEADAGYKCLLEDISEDGAMIRIGGRGVPDTPIMLQFELNGSLVIMHGIVRAVEWNKNIGQSRLHFECMHIDRSMRNTVLTYIYNVMPPEQKEINEAIAQAKSLEKKAEDAQMEMPPSSGEKS